MGYWWDDTGGVKHDCSEKNLTWYHFVYNKRHVSFPIIKLPSSGDRLVTITQTIA
jgi:hypothetical protein